MSYLQSLVLIDTSSLSLIWYWDKQFLHVLLCPARLFSISYPIVCTIAINHNGRQMGTGFYCPHNDHNLNHFLLTHLKLFQGSSNSLLFYCFRILSCLFPLWKIKFWHYYFRGHMTLFEYSQPFLIQRKTGKRADWVPHFALSEPSKEASFVATLKLCNLVDFTLFL